MIRDPNPLPDKYFNWLYDKAFPRRRSTRFTYKIVTAAMHAMPFNVLVPLDDNRAADGLELRKAFLQSQGGQRGDLVDYREASIFEVLIALANRAERMIGLPQAEMFAIFMDNLDLSQYHDDTSRVGVNMTVVRILRRFNNRKYTARGAGGLFPLMSPITDQRRQELWYQMGEYMAENGMY